MRSSSLPLALLAAALLGAGCDPDPAPTWRHPCPGQLAPSEIGASTSSSGLALTWDAHHRARSFRVERQAEGQEGWDEVGSGEGPFFVDEEVAADERYAYRVHAEGDGCEAPAHDPVIAFGPPLPPSDVGASVFSEVGITLAWTDDNRHATGFVVELTDEGGEEIVVRDIPAEMSSLSLGGFVRDTWYQARVGAENPTSEAPAFSEPTPVLTAPYPVDDLRLSALSHEQVELTWEHYNDHATGILIERKLAEAIEYVEHARLGPEARSYVDDVEAWTFYRYRVRVESEAGLSDDEIVSGSAWRDPLLMWTEPASIDDECVLRSPGAHLIDAEHGGAFAAASATASGALEATGLYTGVEVSLGAPFLGPVSLIWRVEDTLGGSAELERSLTLALEAPVETLAPAGPSGERGGDVGDGRQPLAPGPAPEEAGCDRACFGPRASVALGAAHTCFLDEDRGVRCFGAGAVGQLGAGSFTTSPSPAAVCDDAACAEPLKDVLQLAAGGDTTCALTATGTVRCWGQGEAGQLGDGRFANAAHATRVCTAGTVDDDCAGETGALLAVQVDVGPAGACAVTEAEGVYCWGGLSAPTPALAGVRQVVVGAGHACALTAVGAVHCWGEGEAGQLGDGLSGAGHQSPAATPVLCGQAPAFACASGELAGVASLTAGDEHTCAIVEIAPGDDADRYALCWGRADAGQLGGGDSPALASAPARVCAPGEGACGPDLDEGALHDLAGLAAAGEKTCALGRTGRVLCWGAGAASPGEHCAESNPPDECAGGSLSGQALAVGPAHACLVTGTSAPGLSCFGADDEGQLGRGQTSPDPAPTAAPACASGAGGGCAPVDDAALRRCGRLGALEDAP